MTWLARVYVLPKEEVLDPQGEAIGSALRHLGFETVGSVRSGRLFDLHITAQNRTEAENQADEAARQLLCNTVVETYTVTVVEQ